MTPKTFKLSAVFEAADPPTWLEGHLVAVRTNVDPRDAPDTLAEVSQGPLESQAVLGWLSDKRRRHWLAGRRAAIALAPSLEWGPGQRHIETTGNGAPILVQGPLRQTVSITHSGGWAMAAFGPTPILGIDYEVGLGDKLHLKSQVCSRREILAHHLEDERILFAERCRQMAKVWVLKEAFLKAFGVGLVADLKGFMATSLESDVRLRFEGLRPLHAEIPYPIPKNLWAAVTTFHGFPLAVVAAPHPQTDSRLP